MTSRRDFLRRCALLAAGTVAADQFDILERLTHSKVFATGGYGVRVLPGAYGVTLREGDYITQMFGKQAVALVRHGSLVGYVTFAGNGAITASF